MCGGEELVGVERRLQWVSMALNSNEERPYIALLTYSAPCQSRRHCICVMREGELGASEVFLKLNRAIPIRE